MTKQKRLHPGVQLVGECNNLVRYEGTKSAFIAAGLLKPEWVSGLGSKAWAIVVEPDGGFTVVNDGQKGNYVTLALRQRGLFSIRRAGNGDILRVAKYRTRQEELEYRDKEDSRRRQQQEKEALSRAQETWTKAKETRVDNNLDVWARAVMRKVKEVENLAEGTGYFVDMPRIKFSRRNLAMVRRAIDNLKRVMEMSEPVFADLEARDNVINLRPQAYSYISAARG